jgi:hypothetical protein
MEDEDFGKLNSRRLNENPYEIGSFFRCRSNDYISVIAACDGVIDCFDASDELECIVNKNGMLHFICLTAT